MANIYITLFIFISVCSAFPTHRQKLTTPLTRMSSQSTTHSFDGQRDRISSDRIFFIETGFGNDSHGQVSGLFCSKIVSLLCAWIVICSY